MAAKAGTLIHLLLILFGFDIIRKFFFKQNDISKNSSSLKKESRYQKDEILQKKDLLNKENNKYLNEDDEFAIDKKSDIVNKQNGEEIVEKDNSKMIIKILTIKYDKYLYEKNFIKLKNEIENNFTNIFVDGKEYPVPENKKYFSKFTYITQIGVSLLLFFSKGLKLGLPFLSDNTIKILEDYKWFIILGNFVIHFWLNKFLLTTGAFEIIYKNKIIYSKLENHTLPNQIDLKKIIKILRIKRINEEDS